MSDSRTPASGTDRGVTYLTIAVVVAIMSGILGRYGLSLLLLLSGVGTFMVVEWVEGGSDV